MRNIIDILKEDHAKAKRLFEQYKEDGSDVTLEQLLHALAQHMKLEEQIVYPAFVSFDADAVKHSRDEHDEARQFIDDIHNSDGDKKKLAVNELESAINHHVKEEEEKIFPEALETLTESLLEQLGTDFEDYSSQQL